MVVGDGAVGLCGVLAAARTGAERVVALSRHESRQKIAREFGATHIIAERGDEAKATVLELTGGVGADSELPLEAVAGGYRAMHERRSIKVLLRPSPGCRPIGQRSGF